MSNTIAYIEEHGVEKAIEYFTKDLHLKMKQDGRYLLLDYNQIDSPRKHPIVDECRGAIIDLQEMEYACRPFNRFYNYGEYPELEKDFDWHSASVREKVDGSLIKVWYNIRDGRWEIATRGSLFGDNAITTLSGEEGQITFRELFLRALKMDDHEFNRLTSHFFPCGWTFLFELCTIENKVVTAYEGDQVYLLGVRRNTDGEEFQLILEDYGLDGLVNYPTRYDIRSFEEAVQSANKLPNLMEGYVITDGQNRRLKIKSVAYVAAHHLRGEGVTPKRAVLLALAGEIPEFCSYFPEYLPLLLPYQKKVDRLRVEILVTYNKYHNIEDQKEFALAVKDLPYSGILFSMRRGQSLDQIIDYLSVASKVSIFGA